MSNINRQKIVDSVPQKGFFGHPKGLFTLFLHRILGAFLLLWDESNPCLLYVLQSFKRWTWY